MQKLLIFNARENSKENKECNYAINFTCKKTCVIASGFPPASLDNRNIIKVTRIRNGNAKHNLERNSIKDTT